MRQVGRFVIFTIVSAVSVGTVTCPSWAQTSGTRADGEANDSSSGLVDPWRDERTPQQQTEASVLIDPWLETAPSDLIIVDPWRAAPRAESLPLQLLELVDPWQDGAPRRVPTARFPLVDPWRAR